MIKRKPLLILTALYLFHLASNFFWLKMDTRYFLFDPAWYYMKSLVRFEAMQVSLPAWISASADRSGFFVYLVTTPFYFIFGSSQQAAAMISGGVFLAILLFSVYGIGKKLEGERTGLLAAFIVSMYPVVFNQLRVYMFDLPLCAVVSLNVYLLLCTDYFKNKLPSVLYIFSLFLGALIKFNFLAFVIGPLLLVINSPKISVRGRKQFIILLIIAAGLAAFFYYPALKSAFLYAGRNSVFSILSQSTAGGFGEKSVALGFIWIYACVASVLSLVNDSISFFFSTAFLVSLFIGFRTRSRHILFLLLPVLIPFFLWNFFFFTIGFTPRYLLPGLALVALITALGIMRIKKDHLRRSAVVAIVIIGLLQYLAISYGNSWLPSRLKMSLPKSFLRTAVFSGSFSLFGQELIYENRMGYSNEIILWQQENRIFPQQGFSHPQNDYRTIENVKKVTDSCSLGKNSELIFLDYSGKIAELLYPLQIELLRKLKTKDVIRDPLFLDWKAPFNRYFPVSRYLLSVDYVAVINEDSVTQDPDLRYFPELKKEIDDTRKYFFENISLFEPACALELSGGTKLTVYKNKHGRIKRGPLEVKLTSKGAMIFYQGKQLTEDIGLSGYFKYNGKYYSIFDICCQLEESRPDGLAIRFAWPELGVSQVWRLSLIENGVNWRVYLYNSGKLPLEEIGLQLRLIPDYVSWQGGIRRGNFLPRFPGTNTSRRIKLNLTAGDSLVIRPAAPTAQLPGFLYRPQNNYGQKNPIELYTSFARKAPRFRIVDFRLGDYVQELSPDPYLIFSENLYFFTDTRAGNAE